MNIGSRPAGWMLLGVCALLVVLVCPPAGAQTMVWSAQDSFLIVRVYNGRTVNLTVSFRQVVCSDTSHCIAIGTSGSSHSVARYTDDGGRTWRTVLIDSAMFETGRKQTFNFHDVAMPTQRLAIMVGDSGAVFRSDDGCASWRKIDAGTRRILSGIYMYDSLHGVISGGGYTVLRTDDGGLSWRPVPLPPDVVSRRYVSRVAAMPSPSTLVLTAGDQDEQVTYHSADTGATWQLVSREWGYQEFSFVDSLHGWACGYEPTGFRQYAYDVVGRTTDGGRTWRRTLRDSIDPAYGLAAIAFASRDHGVAVGWSGKVLVSDDGGEHWTVASLPEALSSNITGVSSPFPGYVWASTVSSTVLHGRPSPVMEVVRASSAVQPMIAPNPAAGSIAIRHEVPGPVRVVIHDVRGSPVYRSAGASASGGAGEETIDVSFLPQGLYFVSISSEGGRRTVPLVIVR